MRTFWMVVDGTEAGLIQFEFQSEMPGTDLRIRSAYRGRGLGTLALRWLTDYVFNELPELHRLECPTREDNHAMRRAFVTCGFTLEAQFREAWPTAEGTFKDTMVYGILRREWASGTRAPVAPTTSVT